MLKSIVNLVSCRPLDRFFAWRHRRRWLNTEDQGKLHESYFADYQSRRTIGEAIAGVIAAQHLERTRILEFGCSGGNNLRLIRELVTTPVTYCGLDIQPEAIAFAREHFPDDTFRVIRGDEFEELKQTLGQYDIFLVSGVLSYLPQKEAESVFSLAHHVAPNLVVCDVTERFALPVGANDGLFLHPYQRLCSEAGFRVTTPPVSDPPDRFAVFVARAE